MTAEDIDRFLPEERKYSVMKIDTKRPPGAENAALKQYEVNDLDEASTPNLMTTKRAIRGVCREPTVIRNTGCIRPYDDSR